MDRYAGFSPALGLGFVSKVLASGTRGREVPKTEIDEGSQNGCLNKLSSLPSGKAYHSL